MAPVDMPPADTVATAQSAYVVVFDVSTDCTASSHNRPPPEREPTLQPLPALDAPRLPVEPVQRAGRLSLSSLETETYVAAPLPRARSPPGCQAGAVFW